MRNLIKPELIGAQDPHIIRKSFVGVLSYSLGVATAWLSVHLAFVIYMITTLFFITPPQASSVAQSEGASASPREAAADSRLASNASDLSRVNLGKVLFPSWQLSQKLIAINIVNDITTHSLKLRGMKREGESIDKADLTEVLLTVERTYTQELSWNAVANEAFIEGAVVDDVHQAIFNGEAPAEFATLYIHAPQKSRGKRSAIVVVVKSEIVSKEIGAVQEA